MSLPLERLSERQSAALERCTALAVSRSLRVLWRGAVKVSPFAGAPCWGVSSGSRAGLAHVVWLWRGHLLCSCEAARSLHVVTCSHAACVRLALAAAAAVPASVPAAVAAAWSPSQCLDCRRDDLPLDADGLCPRCAAPLPPAPPSRLARLEGHCQRCGVLVDADELAELGGECLDCLLDLRPQADELRDAERKQAARQAIIAREKARQARYRREGRTAANDPRRDPAWDVELAAQARQSREQDAERRDTAHLIDNRSFSIFKS